MSAVAIQTAQLNLIQEILGVKDMDILSGTAEYLRNAIHKVVPRVDTAEAEIDESEPAMAREEIIDGLNAMCEQIKQVRAGKLEGTSWEEFRHELL